MLTLLDLHDRVDQRHEDQAREKWRWFVDRIGKASKDVTHRRHRQVHRAPRRLRQHHQGRRSTAACTWASTCSLKWLDTTAIDADQRRQASWRDCHGIIVPGGFGVRGTEGKIECIRYARENKVPYLGLCLGFQMAVIEFARNVCGIADANSSEFDPRCKNPVIDILPEQKKIEGLGGNMRLGGKDVELKPGTLASRCSTTPPASACASATATRSIPSTFRTLEEHGMIFSGKHPTQPIMQMLELPQDVHPYFIGTQAHPELTSRPLAPAAAVPGLRQGRDGTRRRRRPKTRANPSRSRSRRGISDFQFPIADWENVARCAFNRQSAIGNRQSEDLRARRTISKPDRRVIFSGIPGNNPAVCCNGGEFWYNCRRPCLARRSTSQIQMP